MIKMKNLLAWATTLSASALAQYTFTNPLIWQDLPDIDIFRVDDTFYYSASTMHYSPGAPILKSYNLVDWEFIGHSVPELNFGAKYYLNGSGSAYDAGVWASSMRYRQSNGLFYWYGCIDSAKTYIFTASDPAGEWTQHEPLPECYYDLGLLIDDDDTMYLAYGKYNIGIAELSEDGMSVVSEEFVWLDDERYLEGSRFYHINDNYYIWLTKPANEQHVLKADNPFGPYTEHEILVNMASPVPNAGVPHQGGLVDTPNGDWFYTAFLDSYPNGRIPVLAPITWDSDGWPSVVTDANGGWGKTYPVPTIETDKMVTPVGAFSDSFTGNTLKPEWEWNHNPDNSAWGLRGNGLTLGTATITTNLHEARNTLSHRINGPKSSGTFRLNLADMIAGDVAGVAIIRDVSASLGARKEADGSTGLHFTTNITMEAGSSGFENVSEGTVVASLTEGLESIASGEKDLWLRITADVTPTFGVTPREGLNTAQLQYSLDGESFTQLGPDFQIHNRWQFFMGSRFAVFNYAAEKLGGSVLVKGFDLQLGS